MARPLRLEYEGAFYHVTSRGNERKKIFFTETDHLKFLDYLKEAKKKYGILLHGYVLMTNHYHLLIETPEANLSKVMHYLNGAYTTYVNIKKKRNGHLFQGRYKAIIVDRDSYLGELSRYIHLNPVRAGLVNKPEDYPYSSYRAYISAKVNDMITTDLVLRMVGAGKSDSRERYRAFVEAGDGRDPESPTAKIYGGMILGGSSFVKETLKKLKDEYWGKAEISHRRALQTADRSEDVMALVAKRYNVTVDDVMTGRNPEAKKVAIFLLKKHTGMTNAAIGKQFGGVSYSAVTKTCRRLEEDTKKSRNLRAMIAHIDRELSNVKG